jgi:hypothetical protein
MNIACFSSPRAPSTISAFLLLAIQPVIPVSITKDWNLVVRTILPVIDQKRVFGPGSGSQSGLGNTVQSFFLSPKAPGTGHKKSN